ncbi:MAG TPA: hypothetical protein EYG38_12635, partial [Verrucomicrobia bacterium]|nr:hypothetical protein [Verrucomicrobiota bacterium]
MIQKSGLIHSLIIGLLVSPILVSAADNDSPHNGIHIKKSGEKLSIFIGQDLLTEYHYQGDIPFPNLYPVMGPENLPMTRNFPMKNDGENEAKDHKHHRSLWYTHGEVNGLDFWSNSACRIVHKGFKGIESGENKGTIRTTNAWTGPDGKVVCTDDRTWTFYTPKLRSERIIDFEITVHASNGDVVMGDTKEGSMALRLAPTLRLKGDVGQGNIQNSNGEEGNTTWGKRAKWCDYYGPIDGKTVGVAIFDHPDNPRHPTWWHVRDYGLFAANPFGIHNFEKKEKGVGDLKIPSGKSITFKYRLYFHSGNTDAAEVGKYYQA